MIWSLLEVPLCEVFLLCFWSREHAGECPARRGEWLWLVKRTGPGVKEVSELPDPNPRVSYRYRDVCDGVTLFCEGITFDRKVVER